MDLLLAEHDHEVQGRTVIKPPVGWCDDGPGDAAVILPVRGSYRGLAVACGINPRYGRLDPFANGLRHRRGRPQLRRRGSPPPANRPAGQLLLGQHRVPETLGSLVLAAQACHDLALAYKTPFISGKDSLNNEYAREGRAWPFPTLLIYAIGEAPDVRGCVTMVFKEPGNLVGAGRQHPP